MCNRVAPDILFFATPFDFLCIILFVIYLFYFHLEHGVGCSDIQMVTRTPGRRKRLIKPFCPFTTTKAPCPQQHPFFSGKYFGILYFIFSFWNFVFRISENIIVWSRGRRPQKSGIPRELPRLTFAPSYRRICPPMRICFALAAQFLLKI